MANWLISRGHNTEYRDPFKYPIKKLISTYRINKVHYYQEKSEDYGAMIMAIGFAFGGGEVSNIFEEQIERWRD